MSSFHPCPTANVHSCLGHNVLCGWNSEIVLGSVLRDKSFGYALWVTCPPLGAFETGLDAGTAAWLEVASDKAACDEAPAIGNNKEREFEG